ncbi:hypothetical protein [Shinella sp. NM-101]|uniref:hypothetical protein n=1 Tax=Shinella sp. NM-101 TaxID=2744455 RepID=UPI001F300C32
MRFVLRTLSLFALVVAVMAGAIDAIQSVSASEPVLTPLAVAWSTASPGTIALVADGIMRNFPYAWDPAAMWVLSQPAFAVLLAVSLLFWTLAYKRPPVAGRFTV